LGVSLGAQVGFDCIKTLFVCLGEFGVERIILKIEFL
jgi:hypothetical protein